MSDLLMSMPLEYEPLRKNRFLLRFPSDLGIQSWWVASASRPTITMGETEIPFLNTSTWVVGRYKWEQINITTLNSWASKFSRWIEDDFYWHSLRHFFTTKLSESGMPDSVIQTLISWESADMCRIYIDTPADTQIANYFTNVKEDKAVE